MPVLKCQDCDRQYELHYHCTKVLVKEGDGMKCQDCDYSRDMPKHHDKVMVYDEAKETWA